MQPLALARCAAALLLVASCSSPDKGERAAASEGTRASATVAAAAPETPADLARKLALAEPTGDSPADRQLLLRRRAASGPRVTPDAWILLGRAWVQKARQSSDPGFYLHARACADLALAIDPSSRLARGLLALVKYNEHDFAGALAAAETILAEAPADLQALAVASDALLELGRFEDAAARAQTLVDLKPNLISYSRAAHLRWLSGDDAGAKKIVKLAMGAGDPEDPEPTAWVTVQAAMMFWHHGDIDGADAGFLRALAAMPNYPPALVGRARVAMARKQHAQAADLLALSYRESPLVETAWLLGDAQLAAGRTGESEKAYALVEKEGRLSDERTLSAFLSTKNRDPARAVQLAKKELAVRADVYTKDVLAWALYRAGALDEAAAAAEDALALGTPDARLLYHAGAIKLARGEVEPGRKLVERALALNPAFDWSGADEARALLATPR